VYAESGTQLGQFQAGNKVDSTKGGPWSFGVTDMAAYFPRPLSDPNNLFTRNGSFGQNGCFASVNEVPQYKIVQSSPNPNLWQFGDYVVKNHDPASIALTRTGLWIHGGREDRGGYLAATNGCIRVSNDDIKALKVFYDADPVHFTRIYVVSAHDGIVFVGATGAVRGGSGRDQISGSNSDDILQGTGGDDLLFGGRGADQLDGGAGADTASYFGAQRVTVDLRTGEASHAGATDTLVSIESIQGSERADVITGSGTANRLIGNAGNDTIKGMAGNDQIVGDYVDQPGTGDDFLDGGGGKDTLIYSGATGDLVIDLSMTTAQATNFGLDRIINIENIVSGGGDDSLTGSSQSNIINGGLGKDTLCGGPGVDTLVGGPGADVFVLSFAELQNALAGHPELNHIVGFRPGVDKIDLSQIIPSSTYFGIFDYPDVIFLPGDADDPFLYPRVNVNEVGDSTSEIEYINQAIGGSYLTLATIDVPSATLSVTDFIFG
jgi:Ca2+-binding RTX toxin-like protein